MAGKDTSTANPELLLTEFTNRLLRLRAASSFIEGQACFDEDLQNLIRKFRISSILANRYTVCIAGSQGAGKTTLLRNIYGLEKTWLADNSGRGEKVPLLVVEDEDIAEPWGEVQVIGRSQNGAACFEERRVTPDEFRTILQGWLPEHVLPILHVPARYFHGANLSFLLLPGYEVGTEATRYWQDLMRHALLASAACIVVTDASLMAEVSQREILADLQRQYLDGSRPVIAVARTENLSEEERQQLTQTAAGVFAVAPPYEQRIVCVGTGTGSYLDSWRQQIMTAVQTYCTPSVAARQRKLSYLDGILAREVPELLGRVQLEFSSASGVVSAAEREKNAILEELDKRVSALRVKYRKQLATSLQGHTTRALKSGRERYKSEEEGFGRNVANIWRYVMKSSGEREDIHLERINSVWEQPGDIPGGFSPSYTDALRTLTIGELHIAGAASAGNAPTGNLLGYGASMLEDEPISDLTPAVQSGIQSLFNPRREDARALASEERKEMLKALKLVPVLALEYVRLNQIFLADAVKQAAVDAPQSLDLHHVMKNANESVQGLADTHSSIIKAIATILAVDVAADGKIDTLPALFAAIKQVVEPAAVVATGTAGAAGGAAAATNVAAAGSAAGAGVAMAAACTVAVAFMAYAVVNQVQQQDAVHRHFIVTAINSIRDQHMAQYTELYDDLMHQIRETLESRLSMRYRLDEGAGRRDSIVRSLADVETMRGDLQEAIRADYAMG